MPIEIDPIGLNVADPEARARFYERLLGPLGRVRGRTVMPRPGTERISTRDRAAGAMQGLTRRAALAWGTALLAPAALSACGGGATPEAEEPRYASLRLPVPVSQHAALPLGGLRVEVVGGSRGLSTLSASVDAFDAATGAWSSLALTGRAAADAAGARMAQRDGAVHREGAPARRRAGRPRAELRPGVRLSADPWFFPFSFFHPSNASGVRS